LGRGLGWAKEACFIWGECTLAPPGRLNHPRVAAMRPFWSNYFDHLFNIYVAVVRDDECRGATSGGAWLSHAVSAGLSTVTVRDHAGVLAQGGNGTADVRDSAVEAGRVLHFDRK